MIVATVVSGDFFQRSCFHFINISFSPYMFQESYILELLVLDASRGSWF